MGKIADALERHDKENTVKLEDLKDKIPKRLVVEKLEVSVPKEAVFKREVSDKLVTLSDPDSADAESFKVLRGQILFPRDRQTPKSILVTSAYPAEGKTYVAANFALTLALSIDEYVVAIDTDLRRPRLHLLFGYRNTRGLHDYLVGGVRWEDVILESGIDKLSLLPAGKIARNATELLSSHMMTTFLGEVKEKFKDRFVIIDSPPCHIMAETKSLAQQVDGIIFVVMANKTPRKDIENAIDNLGREKILGIVFNGYEQVRKSYYRYYDRYYKSK
jgi:exopolysaccharide/PEP-CTERM locus tyrosine autokinase